jgi:hypothetical protein
MGIIFLGVKESEIIGLMPAMWRKTHPPLRSRVCYKNCRHTRQDLSSLPLPPGMTPVEAGRIGLWLMGQRNQRAASRRRALPSRVYGRSLADRFRGLITPWLVHEYPGTLVLMADVLMAELCGVKPDTARNWCKRGHRLPPHQARRMAGYLRTRAAEELALADELEAMAKQEELLRSPRRPVAGLNRWQVMQRKSVAVRCGWGPAG